MTAYAETAATIAALPNTGYSAPGQSLRAALHRALEAQSFELMFNAQIPRGTDAAQAMALSLAIELGSQTLNLAECGICALNISSKL